MIKRLTQCLSLSLMATTAAYADQCDNFLRFGNDIEQTRTHFQQTPEKIAWQWFVCLNQEQGGRIRYWEQLLPTSRVYLKNGATPEPFDSQWSAPQAVLDQAKAMGMDVSRVFHNLDADLQVDGLPLEMGGDSPKTPSATFVRYQLLMSEDTFNYIVDKKVYNVNGQAALTAPLKFPSSAWELKTSWLWIGDNKPFLSLLKNDQYYIINAYYLDQNGQYQAGYAALSGMHVINKLFDDWVWITFENQNNHKYTIDNQMPANPMVNITGPTPDAKVQNSSFQREYPMLGEYELIGVQYRFDGEPKLLASSQMESAFQSRSSCIDCHHTAAYSKEDGYYNFAHKEQGGILYPIDKTPDSAFAGYQMLDFVWSLKRAQWRR